jgi:hypothetical protein
MKSSPWFKKAFSHTDEKGIALVISLLLILVYSILSLAGMISTSTKLKISSKNRSAKQVFYVAEAGTEEARSRLQCVANPSPIPDNQPTNPDWTLSSGPPLKPPCRDMLGTVAKFSILGFPLTPASLWVSITFAMLLKHKVLFAPLSPLFLPEIAFSVFSFRIE